MASKELNELEQLANEAATDQTLNPSTETETKDGEKKPDPKEEAKAIVNLATETLIGAYPELESIYTPERNAKIAEAFAYTFKYYGMTLGGFMGHPLFVIGAAVLPVIPPTYRAATKGSKTNQVELKEPKKMTEIVDTSDPSDLFNKV